MFCLDRPQEVNEDKDGSEFEVVLISSDDDEAAAHNYMQEMHGNWLMLPYTHPLRQELKRKLRIFGAKEQDVCGYGSDTHLYLEGTQRICKIA